MRTFADLDGQSWEVAIDGISLGELREKGVDLVNHGLYLVEQQEDTLLKALLVLCREQREKRSLSERQFARLITGLVNERALEAVRGAAEDFFPPKRWSEILSRLDSRRKSEEMFSELGPVLEMLSRPEMPPMMRQSVLDMLTTQIEAALSSLDSEDKAAVKASASGLLASLSNAAGDSQASSESIHAA